MMDGLQHQSPFQNINEHAGFFFLSRISSYMNLRNDVLSSPINKLVLEGSMNPLLPLSGGTFHEISSPVFRRDPINYGPVIGIGMASLIMKRLITVAVEAPLVRVKLLLQNQGELIKSGRLSTPYKGIMDCFARTIKNEGVLSLWKGNSAALLRIIPDQALHVVSIAVFKKLVYKFRGDKNGNQNWVLGNMVAAVGASTFCCLFSYPLEFAHTRLANDIKSGGGKRQFKGLFDVYIKTLKSDGIAGIYRGFGVSCLAIVVHICLTNPGRYRVKREHKQKTSLGRVVLDSCSIVIAPFVTYPLNTVSRRMMMTSGEAFKYNNAILAFFRIIQNEGFLSLYNGFGANVLRFVPAVCVLAAWGKWVKHTKSGACISVVVETK